MIKSAVQWHLLPRRALQFLGGLGFWEAADSSAQQVDLIISMSVGGFVVLRGR